MPREALKARGSELTDAADASATSARLTSSLRLASMYSKTWRSWRVHDRSECGQIRRRAYELYEARGREPGHELEDWLQAETEVIGGKPLVVDLRSGPRAMRSWNSAEGRSCPSTCVQLLPSKCLFRGSGSAGAELRSQLPFGLRNSPPIRASQAGFPFVFGPSGDSSRHWPLR